MQGGWTGFAQYDLQTNKLPAVLQSVLSLVGIALRVTSPSPPAAVLILVERGAPDVSNTYSMVAEKLSAFSHARKKTTAVHLCKCKNLSTIARLHMKPRLITATKPLAAVVKTENVLEGSRAAESLQSSPEALAAQKALLQAMETVCCHYTKDFQSLHEMHEL